MAGAILLALSRHDLPGRPLLADSRHMMLLFPGFMLMGRYGRNPRLHRLIFYSFFALFIFMMGVYFQWGFLE